MSYAVSYACEARVLASSHSSFPWAAAVSQTGRSGSVRFMYANLKLYFRIMRWTLLSAFVLLMVADVYSEKIDLSLGMTGLACLCILTVFCVSISFTVEISGDSAIDPDMWRGPPPATERPGIQTIAPPTQRPAGYDGDANSVAFSTGQGLLSASEHGAARGQEQRCLGGARGECAWAHRDRGLAHSPVRCAAGIWLVLGAMLAAGCSVRTDLAAGGMLHELLSRARGSISALPSFFNASYTRPVRRPKRA